MSNIAPSMPALLDIQATHSDDLHPALHATPASAHALAVTLIRSELPSRLNKSFHLDNGALKKTASAHLVRGCCERLTFPDLTAFDQALEVMPPHAALTYGVTDAQHAQIVAQKDHRDDMDAITRTRRFFSYRRAPGIWMLDHDADGERRLDPDDLIAALTTAAPVLADAPMLWRASSSSNIVTPDGIDSGLKGQRLYLPVCDAALIPAAGKALVQLLWANGQGWIEIGKAGQALQRTLVDAVVWQPERLDFVAPPTLADGITRTPPPSRILGDPAARFDLRQLIDLADGTIQAQAVSAQKAATAAKMDACHVARETWVEQQAPVMATQAGITLERAKAALMKAANTLTLTGDFLLIASDGTEVTVGALLDNPGHWHGRRFHEPLEPDYGNRDARIAWANLRSGGRPTLFSHAHGGRRFTLLRPAKRIQLRRGDRARVVDQCLDLTRERGELFDFGDGAALVRITDDARALPVNRDWLTDFFDRTMAFYVQVERKKEGDSVFEDEPADAPQWAATRIIAKDGERGLPRLNAIVTAPTLRLDGSILDAPGYDAPSRLLFLSNTPDLPHLPTHPSQANAANALQRLWAPFAQFPLVDAVDRAVVLAALLTACVRASLPTAPGFGFDAPTAGTGKTLLAQAIGALFTGDLPPALPPASTQDEEARKRLFAALRDNHRTILWDNIREPFGNAALDAFLTASTFTDRILGKSETATLPNRALFLATGNNLRLVGDTCRRVLMARLDARIEQPYRREFEFCPAQMALSRRYELVAAGLTLIRAWITAGRPRHGKGRSASFEGWDELVRQPVCWVASWSHDLQLADPLNATERAFEADPESSKLAALLDAWARCFAVNIERLTVAKLIQYANTESNYSANGYPIAETDDKHETRTALRDALMEIAGERGGTAINPRMLGRWIERHAERRLNGRRFVQDGMSHHAKRWMVASDTAQRAEKNSRNSPNSPFPESGATDREHNSPPNQIGNSQRNQTSYDERWAGRGELGSYREFFPGQDEASEKGSFPHQDASSQMIEVEGEL